MLHFRLANPHPQLIRNKGAVGSPGNAVTPSALTQELGPSLGSVDTIVLLYLFHVNGHVEKQVIWCLLQVVCVW